MAHQRKEANLKMLAETQEVQDKTVNAVARIQKQTAETEELAITTLDELRKQGAQIDDVNEDLEAVSVKLDQSQALQNRFDLWAGNWFGGKRKQALKDAAKEIATKNKEDMSLVKEVFENEKYDRFGRVWKPCGMVLCSNPTVEAPMIFDPASQIEVVNSNWLIDFSFAGIDAEGWTYAGDFNKLNSNGSGESSAKWNCYVRRRKWRYHEKTSDVGETLEGVRQRNVDRMNKRGEDNKRNLSQSQSQGEKVAYVPRSRPAAMATGLTSTSMAKPAPDQQLDGDSQAGLERVRQKDAEIDQGVNAIMQNVDTLGRIAGDMRDETTSQNMKLEKMQSNMERAAEKQTVVNARQKKLLRSN